MKREGEEGGSEGVQRPNGKGKGVLWERSGGKEVKRVKRLSAGSGKNNGEEGV